MARPPGSHLQDDDHGHDEAPHDHSHASIKAAPDVARILHIIVVVLVLLTAVGLFVWPRQGDIVPFGEQFGGQGDRVDATVTGNAPEKCEGATVADVGDCVSVEFEVTSGENTGGIGSFQMYPDIEQTTPTFDVSDKIVVNEFFLGDTGERAYTFADFQRTTPLIWLVVLFLVAVLALGRFQGVRALAGLAVSVVVLFYYIFPALLGGEPPLAVALVGSSVIALAALYITHGVNDTTTVALLGTISALGLTGILAAVFTRAAQITGLASEDQILLNVSAEGIDVRGLVLAGIVIGTLGVLDDVTVTQVSAVARLREANPNYTVRQLYTSGVRIGRDHIASTVNTLVLAYAGAALPLLLFYSNIGITWSESITAEIIAVEVVRTLVGSIGLVAAVPITTGLAAVVVSGTGTGAFRFSPSPATRRARRSHRNR